MLIAIGVKFSLLTPAHKTNLIKILITDMNETHQKKINAN